MTYGYLLSRLDMRVRAHARREAGVRTGAPQGGRYSTNDSTRGERAVVLEVHKWAVVRTYDRGVSARAVTPQRTARGEHVLCIREDLLRYED